MRIIFLLCLLAIANPVISQDDIEIEGKIVNSTSKESIPFAVVYNKSSKKGTLSNTDGYFRIKIKGINDTIQVSYIGFKNQTIRLSKDLTYYSVNLIENISLLNEIVITANDNSYLFDLLSDCKRFRPRKDLKSKAYYELKSYRDSVQVELLQSYYNLYSNGYDISGMEFKQGRIALKDYNNRYFVSQEGSSAVIMSKLLYNSGLFPVNPLELPEKKMKKHFYLFLDNKFLDNNADSVYTITYKPKDSSGLFFNGKIWINKTKNRIVKITLNCRNAKKFPFFPMFKTDSISGADFFITKYFTFVRDQISFQHIDFIYTINYKSRIGRTEEENYAVKTNVVLHAYDYNEGFFLPEFDFGNISTNDYRKISAVPYNDFFWLYNDEYKLQDSKNANIHFFNDSTTCSSKPGRFRKLFEHWYVPWSKKRVAFRDIMTDTTLKKSTAAFKADLYNFAVKVYLDLNTYRDSNHVITATIFDPIYSYCLLPRTNITNCFINLYFDLCEIKRLELESMLRSVRNDPQRVKEIYSEFLAGFEKQKHDYFNAVQCGNNQREMLKYNSIVFDKLGINNIEIFEPYK